MESAQGRSLVSEGLLVRRLVEQGIADPRVLSAVASVPRVRFVPEELRGQADEDRPLEIGFSQTISQPFVVARMTEALALSGKERVLEVGTGSGYQSAVLAELLPIQAVLRTIERIPELSLAAQCRLAELGYTNIEYRIGDGAQGWPEAAPFDAILVAAAAPEPPEALLRQLALGGRLVMPLGAGPDDQELVLVRKSVTGELSRTSLLRVRFVPLIEGQELRH